MDPVTVVGAGPVGLALALALSRHEVPVVVLDERPAGDADLGERRLARTAVLRPDTAAMLERLGCTTAEGARWTGWRTLRRRSTVVRVAFTGPDAGKEVAADDGAFVPDDEHAPAEEVPDGGPGEPPPLHLPQHALVRELRAALAAHETARIVPDSRVTALRQDGGGVTVETQRGVAWRASHLVGCDGARSTVRKLLDARFPGRTNVERYAVAALRTELPWPGEAVLQRSPLRGVEVTARPLPDGVWRLDWLLPPDGGLVTPEALLGHIHDSLGAWCGDVPPYELLDTGVYAVHHRLARRWRVGRAFLAGDAAHQLGTFGTQGLDEGLRDAGNLAWKLALAWRHGASEALLDSYEEERREAVGCLLRSADRALPAVRGTGGWRAVRRSVVPGSVRGHDAILTEGHLGRGELAGPVLYGRTPLAPAPPAGSVPVGTPVGAPVEDVPVTAPDGSSVRLHDRLDGPLLVVLVAPGTGVWERRHWLGAGLMPGLAAAVDGLPMRAELLVAEGYPGAAAHTVLVVRPDGYLVAALSGVRPAELSACADATRGGAPEPVPATGTDLVKEPAGGTSDVAGASGVADASGASGVSGASSVSGAGPESAVEAAAREASAKR
ncbi:FAD-dependent oxidoreductase [Streptomyces mobaraensis NBRC 13819 = DSM 40847]|uniref:FAD-dependent oxidoreductase n=1 Tax=Streptomyces mobaraensis TaxID=35621 RepID=UPI000997CA0D|nr:FAD-dependent oxidoreductase [Streptomyces mobaraensis]QTT76059.1 FAD-dependent oxidoreductase [Streptomyces mobaraensis NBRC 13819 = DSM 40847]